VKELGLADAPGVVAEGAQAHGAEVLVADRHRLARAPLAVELLARAEEVDVALERALEQLVPVLQVGEDGQRLRRQLVHARAEDVGHLALVDEDGHLALAHGERGAVLDLIARHRVAPAEHAVAALGPLEDVDELLLDEIHQRHRVLPLDCARASGAPNNTRRLGPAAVLRGPLRAPTYNGRRRADRSPGLPTRSSAGGVGAAAGPVPTERVPSNLIEVILAQGSTFGGSTAFSFSCRQSSP
jgi:hypothetical protein